MDNLNFFSLDDLESVFAELDEIEADEAEPTEEEKASKKHYKKIIKKHKNETTI